MCMASVVGDYFSNSFPQRYPNYITPMPSVSPLYPSEVKYSIPEYATKAEIQQLREEILELKKMLQAAIEFDKKTNQPDCHLDEKIQMIRDIAKMVGVDMKDVFPDDGALK